MLYESATGLRKEKKNQPKNHNQNNQNPLFVRGDLSWLAFVTPNALEEKHELLFLPILVGILFMDYTGSAQAFEILSIFYYKNFTFLQAFLC